MNPMSINPRQIDTFLQDHTLIFRIIPGEAWTLSKEGEKYILTETWSPRIKEGVSPRVYRSSDLTCVLLAWLGDPSLKPDRNAKFEERYPIPEGSNIVRLQARKRREASR